MKVGDLVEIDFHVTRRGFPEEDQVGLIVEVRENYSGHVEAVVNFCGVLQTYPVGYLRIVNESR